MSAIIGNNDQAHHPTPTETQPTDHPDYDLPAEDGKRHYSIDLSLELEHQLDMESQPSTPLREMDGEPRHSLDPHVLAHIVSQLRNSLTDVSKERDALRDMLSVAESQEVGLKEAVSETAEKARNLEAEFEEARRKAKDDEDAIAMLRTKVEESRRGLMRLQTESRRQSAAPSALDLSRAGLPNFTGPPSSKRASFTPLTGTFNARPNGHRRISSVSDSGGGNIRSTSDTTYNSSPPSQGIPLPDPPTLNGASHPPVSSRRFSGLFGRSSPPQPELPQDPMAIEVESLRKEVSRLRDELEQTRHELNEATEAKDASELCVKALRSFIAENNVGLGGPSSPPKTSSLMSGDEKSQAGAGWGFKLWKADATTKPAGGNASPVIPQGPTAAAPLSRKIGGFFSSRTASISSISTPPLPHLQTNAPDVTHRNSTYSVSDTSSMVEPVSPMGEINGNIIVRDVTSISDLGSTTVSPELKVVNLDGKAQSTAMAH